MRTMLIAGLLMSVGVSVAVAAHSLDQRPVQVAVVRRQLADLSAVIERYHPLLRNGAHRAAFERAERRLAASMHGTTVPAWRSWLLQQELVRTLDDPHTEVYVDNQEDQFLPLTIHWVSNGIVGNPLGFGPDFRIPRNCQVLRIGPYTPAALLRRTRALFSGTSGFVRAWYSYLPAYYLRWMGAVGPTGQVAVTVRTVAGQVESFQLPLIRIPRGWKHKAISAQHQDWYHWRVDAAHDVGWFTLNQMMPTWPYEQAVAQFFRKVERSGVNRVVVDLRHDGGGWTMAEMPFMVYLGVDRFQDYTRHKSLGKQDVEARIKRGLAFIRTNDSTLYKRFFRDGRAPRVMEVPRDRIYRGAFFVATGPGCFSSAMSFAADVKFNHLGKVIGSPCGELVGGYGDVKEFMHPASGIAFQVPTKAFQWPGIRPGAQVEPDIRIPTTVRDVQHHVDPVHAWFDLATKRAR